MASRDMAAGCTYRLDSRSRPARFHRHSRCRISGRKPPAHREAPASRTPTHPWLRHRPPRRLSRLRPRSRRQPQHRRHHRCRPCCHRIWSFHLIPSCLRCPWPRPVRPRPLRRLYLMYQPFRPRLLRHQCLMCRPIHPRPLRRQCPLTRLRRRCPSHRLCPMCRPSRLRMKWSQTDRPGWRQRRTRQHPSCQILGPRCHHIPWQPCQPRQ